MTRGFGGVWRVREYVYEPATGALLGTVDQRRALARAAHGRVRVVQDCEPDAALADHPMSGFRGHHEFELVAEGAVRRYLGPAVVGAGVSCGDEAMLGRGAWPGFGYGFSSFSVLARPDRQLTGGVFARGVAPMAVIVGVAAPDGEHAPALSGPTWPGDVAAVWRGDIVASDARGAVVGRTRVTRHYDGPGFREHDTELVFESDAAGLRATGAWEGAAVLGFGRAFGWRTDVSLHAGPARIEWMEALDAAGANLVGIRQVWHEHRLQRVEALRLFPEESL